MTSKRSSSRGRLAQQNSRQASLRRILPALAVIAFLALPLVIAAVGLPAAAAFYSGNSGVYDAPESLPGAPIAMVLGAGVTADGQPTLMLADRVDAAVAAYKAGRVDRLLMTGDNSTRGYDEVTVMKERAVAQGVPAEKVNLDYAGFRTYDSCYRARKIFGIYRAVVVSQRYHLPRALYLARSMGIEAVGLAAGRDDYPRQDYYNLRELAALAVSWYEVNLTHPLPRFLGDPVDLERQSS